MDDGLIATKFDMYLRGLFLHVMDTGKYAEMYLKISSLRLTIIRINIKFYCEKMLGERRGGVN